MSKYELEDKRKLIEIKKVFKIEKFVKLLDSKERESVFDALEKVTKIDISFFDGFSTKLGLVNFFKKISNNLIFEPVIAFAYDDFPNLSNHIEFGLLKCVLNKKKDFKIYLINSSWFSKGIPDGDIMTKNCFNLNQIIDEDKFLKILYEEIKWNWPSKIIADEVYLFRKLKWSKEKLKKSIKNKDVRFI